MLDFVQNNNPISVYRALAKFQEEGTFPGFLENYEYPDQTGLRKYASSAFADPDTRTYPILDAASTLLSAICFYGDGHKDERIEQELTKAAEAQGITEWLEKAKELEPEITKSASAHTDYALVLDYGDRQEAFLPMHDEYHLQESARGLAKAITDRDLPLVKAAECARTLVKKASDLDVPEHTLPSLILKFAQDREMDPVEASIQLSLRKRLVDPGAQEIYEDLFKRAAASVTSEELDECTEILEDMDRMNLDIESNRYMGLEDAWSALHTGMSRDTFEKIASAHITLAFDDDSCTIPAKSIADIPEQMIKAAFRSTEAQRILEVREHKTGHELGAELDALRPDIKRELLGLAAKYAQD